MEIVNYIKGMAEGFAHQSSNPDYELGHLKHVERHVMDLAKARHLNIEMALVIAYSHDLGRLKDGFYGKKHAIAGAKIIKKLLVDSNFTSKQRKQIERAVKNHRKKDKIHGPYSELIKDADSLAHLEEGLIGNEAHFEFQRATILKGEKVRILSADVEIWCTVLAKSIERLDQIVNDSIAIQAKSEFWVHDLRIAVRKTRSILWVFRRLSNVSIASKAQQVDQQLRFFSKSLDQMRLLQVGMHKLSLENCQYRDFQEKINKVFDKLMRDYDWPEKTKGIAFDIQAMLEGPIHHELQPVVNELLDELFTRAASAKVKMPKQLHQVRLTAKRLKYLSQMKLIRIEPIGFKEQIVTLSALIGEANDITEIQKMMGEAVFSGALTECRIQINQVLFSIRKTTQ